jgi:lipid-A-disaccharide synthase
MGRLQMFGKNKKYNIFISAAEPSADLHCASLINALKQIQPDIVFSGVGGAKMAQAGCRLLENTVEKAAMIYHAFAHIGHFFLLTMRIRAHLKTNRPDLVIVCDSPAFNFHVAKVAKKAGIKTIFYVAPQLWAWAPWRIKKLKNCCDKLCCILPFEQDWFTQKGVDAVFVGNPLLDGAAISLDAGRKRYSQFDPANARIALMPGSRPAEINTLWQPMQQIALRIKRNYPNVTFTAVAVDENSKERLKSRHIIGFRCSYRIGEVFETAADSDFSIVASGSATLQVAAAGCPMVIMYQSSRLLWRVLGRWLIKTKFLSLVNILADRRLVPEFMPCFSSTEPIIDSIQQLLRDEDKLTQTSSELLELAKKLKTAGAAEKTAEIALQMIRQSDV